MRIDTSENKKDLGNNDDASQSIDVNSEMSKEPEPPKTSIESKAEIVECSEKKNTGNKAFGVIMAICAVIVIVSICAIAFFKSAPTPSPSQTHSANVSNSATTSNSTQNTSVNPTLSDNVSSHANVGASNTSTPSTSVDSYKKAIVGYSETLSSEITRGLGAATIGDVDQANKASDAILKAHDGIMALTPPSGYEEIHSLYKGAAVETKFAANYMVGVATATQSGDSDLADYYANLAADSLEKSAADIQKATELIKKK